MGCPSCRNQPVDGKRTSATGRGSFIHKEHLRVEASQQTEKAKPESSIEK